MKKTICKRPAALGPVVMGAEKYLLCVPIEGKTDEDVIRLVTAANAAGADMIEWRIDKWESYPDAEHAVRLMPEVAAAAEGMGILVTARSTREMDPEADDITDEEKFGLIYSLADTGLAHAFDVEYFYGEKVLREVSEKLHAKGCKLLVALHTQAGKKTDEELKQVLRDMQAWGGDMAKLCVFNETFGDFYRWACLLKDARESYMEIPMISAAERGGISRAIGDAFGTDMIFVTVDGGRQPGIADLKGLRAMLWPEDLS